MKSNPTPAASGAQSQPAASGKSHSPAARSLEELARARVAIEGVWPQIDDGRFPVKRAVGDQLVVEADIFCDGHDKIDAALLYRLDRESAWRETPMHSVDNDRWRGAFELTDNALYLYTIIAWRDLFASWRDEVAKKRAAGVPIALELTEGRLLVEQAVADGARGAEADRRALQALATKVQKSSGEASLLALLLAEETLALMHRAGPRTHLTTYATELPVWVDRRAAAFSAWYELFPRSQSGDVKRHGTFDDVIAALPYVRDMGFDVLYFPPIHPIGRTNRKGRNNALTAGPDDPGSPYAIGGGRRARRHPSRARHARGFRAAGRRPPREHGLEIALDFAIQCSPDHPWLKEHPEWFDWRPDGSISYRREPAEEIRGHRQRRLLRRRRPGSGSRCATSCCSGSSTACASSASTIRTPSRCRSGSG